jgi:RNA polymerase sigma-70 factor, ECF subfamily
LAELYPIDASLLKDEASFEVLFRKLYAPLCRTIFKIVQDKDLAEDIAQDAFFVLWEKRNEVSMSVKSYLYRAAINKAFTQLEKNKRFVRTQEGDWFEYEPAANTTEEIIHEKELQREVNKAIDALPHACRTVFLMSRMDEMSYKEIAEALNISVKTVENQMSKALKLVREAVLVFVVGSMFHV